VNQKKVAILSAMILCGGCASPSSVEPSKVGAQNECADLSANLAQYNECRARVDANFEKYERNRKLDDGNGQ
jgi:hypothetical protein